MPDIAPLNKKIPEPLAWIWIHIITEYIFAPGMKNVKSHFFLHFFSSWGLLPPRPSFNVKLFFLCQSARLDWSWRKICHKIWAVDL